MKRITSTDITALTIALTLCLSMLIMSGTAFAERCVDNLDGTVTDKRTDLMWQKSTPGMKNWDAAMSYASGLSLGGHSGWKLPNMHELMGLYHSPCKYMMDVLMNTYWSSTAFANYADHVWVAVFHDGLDLDYHKSDSAFVRAVRAMQ